MDKARLHCVTEEKIRPLFDLFKVLEIKAIFPENRYNKDEAGIIEGRGTNGLVIRTSDYKALMKNSLGHVPGPFLLSVSQPLASTYLY